MNCRMAEHEMQKALDEPLTAAERVRLDAHLETCPACRRAWEDDRRLARAMSEWVARPSPRETPPAEFTARVLARLETRPRPAPLWPRLLMAGAFVVLMAVLSPSVPAWLPPVPRSVTAWATPDLGDWTVMQGVLLARWAMYLLIPSLVLNALFVVRARRAV